MTTRHDFDDFAHAGRIWLGWIEYACTAPSRQIEAATRETPPEFSEAEFELVDWGEIDAEDLDGEFRLADEPTARAVAEAVFEDLLERGKLEEGA